MARGLAARELSLPVLSRPPSELARPSPTPQAGILGVRCPRPGSGQVRASPGGRGGARPPSPAGAQGPRPHFLHTQGSQASRHRDGNGRLLGRRDPGFAFVGEEVGTAGGPVSRAPQPWGSDPAPCPPPRPGDPAPAWENTEQVPAETGRRQGAPGNSPHRRGPQEPLGNRRGRGPPDSMPPPGCWGPTLLLPGPPGQTGSAPIYLPAPAQAEAAESPREPPRAEPSWAGPGCEAWPWVPRDVGPASGGQGGTVLRG